MPVREGPPGEPNQLRAPDAVTARRALVQSLAIMRATVESTTDAILVIDEKVKVIDVNEKYTGMWKIPREVLEIATLREVRELMSQNFADPRRFYRSYRGNYYNRARELRPAGAKRRANFRPVFQSLNC
jgi:PAS domain-containing protein